jgi:hypothetical protein
MFGKKRAEKIGSYAAEVVKEIEADIRAGLSAEAGVKAALVWEVLNQMPFGSGPQMVVGILRTYIAAAEAVKDSDEVTDADRAAHHATLQAWLLVWACNPKAVALAPELRPLLDALKLGTASA